jgi:microcystin-dependent protein
VLTSNGVGALPTMQTGFSAGMILLWSGSIGSIPTGWLLCDGTLSTPNLRDRFVVGAGSTYAVNATGGSADAVVVSHTHVATVTDPTHFHTYGAAQGITGGASAAAQGTNSAGFSTTAASTGITVSNAVPAGSVSGTNANLPPYYALCYIMKS